MTKKATHKTCFILLFLFILLTGCSTKKASESAVSPEAEAVLNAMFTAPNDDLYSLDSSTVIGENSTADSENASVNSEKILENWNKLVGKYFETGRLEYFISTYGQTYLSEAAYNNTKITVKDISLDSKTDDSETVLVTFKINKEEMVEKKASQAIKTSMEDWDSFETSWNFQHHPLLREISTIAEAFDQWQSECDDRFNQLKSNEEELNRIFIDIYGLQDELIPDVEDKDVTVRTADLGRDIRSFISYAVGCMFGRYSLDVDGLVYAGGEWDNSKYASFAADKDNIIPICDDEYFEDDIVGLFVEFVKTVYGADTLDENMKFIADALGRKGQPKDVIRNYFLNDFYKDHCKIYQKRPIYWLCDSGKAGAFRALFYLHRYDRDTVGRIRMDYVHELQDRLRVQLDDARRAQESGEGRAKMQAGKRVQKLEKQLIELGQYEEQVHHLADMRIPLDLDDGVKVNYAKLGAILGKIK